MTPRGVALAALTACHRQGAWADVALKRELGKAGLDSRDAALSSRLCYGVLQNQLLLDHYLKKFSAIPLEKLEPKVLDILRLGVYQLLFMDKIPPMAAVDESVKLAKTHSKKAGGFVNAVLRNLDRSRDSLPALPREPLEKLSVQYSHPLWLVKEFASTVPEGELEALLAADNAAAPVYAQVNTCKTDADTLLAAWEAEGVTAKKHPWMESCFLLENIGNMEHLKAFQDGMFYIQDPAAKKAVLVAAPKAGERVLDLCAAPGGKSFAAAILMENRGVVESRDVYERKVKELARSASRLGLSILHPAVGNATQKTPGEYDLVIADVPCSGLGIIRKKPDIRYKDPGELEGLLPIQEAILENAAGNVRPGGRLLYATCTLRRRENEGQVEAFLAKHGEFSPHTMETLWPHREGTDGFFFAVLDREG